MRPPSPWGHHYLVIVSGDDRVDEAELADAARERL
jgi:prolyl-tRNA editing enzyme YbaK/EbsC (Cys-tRNA(Pro) deacylase)